MSNSKGKYFFLFLLIVLVGAGISHIGKHFIDYPVYETAALKVLKGDLNNLYDVNRNSPGGYYYPYFFAMMFIPFAAMGTLAGKIAFFILFFGCYLYLLRFTLKVANTFVPIRNPYVFLSIIVLLSTYSFNDALMNANIGLLLLALCVIAYELGEKKCWFWQAVLLAAAVALKIYPIIVVFYYAWKRDWKVFGLTLGLAAFLMFGLPVVLYGYGAGTELVYKQYFVLSHFGNHWPYDSHVFQNIPSTAMRLAELFGLNKSKVFQPSLIISGLAILMFYGKSFVKQENGDFQKFTNRMFVLTLSLVPLLVPVSWYNMGLFYLPLLGCVVAKAVIDKDRFSVMSVVIYTLFYCLCTPDIVGRPFNYWLAYRGFPFWGVLMLVLAFSFETKRLYPSKFHF
jgi:hypothetical protein